jgi:endoglucanase
MRTGMTSQKFRDEMGVGINLGNTMDAYWSSDSRTNSGSQLIGQNTPTNYETCWGGRVVTQSMIDSLKASGFNTVRIPVYWGNMMAEDGTFTIDRDYLARVGEIIDYCRQDGMYVVINIHHYDEYIIKNYPKDQALTIFKNLWSQIAAYYKDYSDYLIFEGFNENVGSTYSGESLSENQIYAYANALNQTFVNAVRRTGGNNASRMLIVSGYWTNIDKTTDSRFQMPTDSVSDRLMVSVHYVDNACYWSNNVGGQSWLDYSRSQCELLKKAFTDQGIVVFVGECTASYESTRFASNAIYKDSAGCTAKLLSMIMDYGFVPVFWDTTGSFYADSSSQAVRNDLQSAIKQVSAK